jgi:hypothetical protein
VALMVLTVVVITGGFVIDVGPLHLSAHRPLPPLVIAAAAYASAMRAGRQSVVAADAALAGFIDRHASAIGVVLAATAAGVGIAFGAYVAAASDPSGYLSQARLIAQGELVVPVPLAARVDWPYPESSFAPLGYRPGLHPAEIVPTYPPGLPLAMALASVVGGENGPFLVGPLFAAVTVFGTYWLAARLHSRTAGVIAAALMASSPLLLSQVVQHMSDIPATALWTLALLAALAGRPISGGAVAGFAVLVRPSLLPVAGAVAIVLAIWSNRRSANRRATVLALVQFAAAMAPGVAVLAAIQWWLYGDPRASGHGTFSEMFAAANVLPNIRDYARRVLTGETPALALITACAALLALVPGPSGPPLARPAKVAALVAMPVLACYLAYGVFTDWAYLRFLLPIWPAALSAAGAVIANASLRLPAGVRSQVLVIALTAVCARNVMTASHEGSFTLWIDAARYGTAGRYLDMALAKDTVIVAMQHSGSARYYTGRTILRWDAGLVGLDEAVADLARLGRPSVILVEEWEEPILREKFPASALARLDWTPRADFGSPTRVRLFDPADRERPTGRPPDRLP